LALAAAAPIARWTALDGFPAKNAHLREKRLRGMAIAGGSILVAMALETILVMRAAGRGRATGELAMSPRTQSAVAVLVAVLGFALVTAFILRWA
jgi:hypothetical protein